MGNLNQVHEFAVKWRDKFKDQTIDYRHLVDSTMGKDCITLGFNMDDSHSFSDLYGNADSNLEVLNKIIDNVIDIQLLGSAIYSRWYYFNQAKNPNNQETILEYANRGWFILALSRLAIISEHNSFIFNGTLRKIRIISNNICYGPIPNSNEEVEQHLTINRKGQVWFSGYNYGHDGEKYQKSRNSIFKINQSSIDKLFIAFETYFSNEYTEIYETDIGFWVMELTNTDGVTFKLRGSLSSDFEYQGIDLSDLVRETVKLEDLFVFNGKQKKDIITKITLDYNRLAKIYPKNRPVDAEWEYLILNYFEKLSIDRTTETLEHVQQFAPGTKITRKYEIEGGIENFLDGFDSNKLFKYIEGNPDDVVENPNEKINYIFTIDYMEKKTKIIKGSFDKKGLPSDFGIFVKELFGFLSFYGLGEIFDPSKFGRVRRRIFEYICCSVIFSENSKKYYYLTDDDSIEIGDFVIVPVGVDNQETIAKVVKIEYYSEENFPFSLEKTKHIIRKCEYEDFM